MAISKSGFWVEKKQVTDIGQWILQSEEVFYFKMDLFWDQKDLFYSKNTLSDYILLYLTFINITYLSVKGFGTSLRKQRMFPFLRIFL